jgi:methylated-DNA-[protein]-cysteine S-methyltransferase
MSANFALNDYYQARVKAPFGTLGVRTEGDIVSEIVFLPKSIKPLTPQNKLAEKVAVQIARYLDDPDFKFKLPLKEVGTEFQRKVWRAISGIPSGHTLSYGAIARHIRTGPRAVGQACGANWFPLVIPCHRVIASGGIGGFGSQTDEQNAGEGSYHMAIKRWLLAHEGIKTGA